MNLAAYPPGWYPDPSRAHELRYFDGRSWTDHVSDHGNVSEHPLGPLPHGLLAWHPPHPVPAGNAPAAPTRKPPLKRVWPWIIAGAVALALATGILTVSITTTHTGPTKSINLPAPQSPVTAGTGTCHTNADWCTITGTITIATQAETSNHHCIGTGLDRDLRAGAQVIVTDSTGRTVGSAPTSDGTELQRDQCTFSFAVRVPNIESYSLTVSGRGPFDYTRADLENTYGWALTLTGS
jgi:hypothetical protein